MSLKDRALFLTTPEQVDAFLKGHARAAIFKAGTCHKTSEGFLHVDGALGPRGDLAFGIIRVVDARAASNRVAEITGIRHESPQLILFRDGRAVFDRDNWDITPEVLASALETHFAITTD